MYQAWPWVTAAQPGDANYVHPTTATVASANTPQALPQVAGQWPQQALAYSQYGVPVPSIQQQWTAWNQYNYAAAIAAGAQIRPSYPQVAVTGTFPDTSQPYQAANTITYQNTAGMVEGSTYQSNQSNVTDSKPEINVNKTESGMDASKNDRSGLKETKESKKELEPKDDAESEKLNQLRAQAQQWKSQQQQTPTWNFNATTSQSTTAVTSTVVTQVTSTAPTAASTQSQWGSGSWQQPQQPQQQQQQPPGSWEQGQYSQQWPRAWEQQDSQAWKSEDSQEKKVIAQEKSQSLKIPPQPTEKSNENIPESQTDSDKEFEEFERQFHEWEKQFESWKEQNMNHPDKKAFADYEKQWQEWRSQLLQRRQQLQLSKSSKSDNSNEKIPDAEQNVGKNEFFDVGQQKAYTSSNPPSASNFFEKERESTMQKIPGLDHLQDESSMTSDTVPLPSTAPAASEHQPQSVPVTTDQNIYFQSQLPLTNAPPPPPPPQVMFMAPQQPFFYQPGLPPPPPPSMLPFQVPRHPPPPITSNLQKDYDSAKSLLPSPTGFKIGQDSKRPLLSTPPQTYHPGASRGTSSGLLPLPPPESRIPAVGPVDIPISSPGAVSAGKQEMMPETSADMGHQHNTGNRYDYEGMYKELPDENDAGYFNDMEDLQNEENLCESRDQFLPNPELQPGNFRDWNYGPDRGPGLPDHGPGLPERGPGFPDRMPGFPERGPGFPERGPGFPERGPGFPERGPGFPERGPGFPERGSGFPDRGPGFPERGGIGLPGGPDRGLGLPPVGSDRGLGLPPVGPDRGLGLPVGPDRGLGGPIGPDRGLGLPVGPDRGLGLPGGPDRGAGGPERGRGRNRSSDRMRGRGRGRAGRESRWSDDYGVEPRSFGNPPDDIFPTRGESRNRGTLRGNSGPENRSTPDWDASKNPTRGPQSRNNFGPPQNFKPENEKGPPSFVRDNFAHLSTERYDLPAPAHDSEFPGGSVGEEIFPLDSERNSGFQHSKRGPNFFPRQFPKEGFPDEPHSEAFPPEPPFNKRKGRPPNFGNVEQFPDDVNFKEFPLENERMPEVLDNERFPNPLTDEPVLPFMPQEGERPFEVPFNRNEPFPGHFDDSGRFPPPRNEEEAFLPGSYPDKFPKDMERRHPPPFFPRERFNPGHIPEGDRHGMLDNPDMDTFRPAAGEFPPRPPFGRNFPCRPPFEEERFPANAEHFSYRNSDRFMRENEFSHGRFRGEFGCNNIPPGEIMLRPDVPPMEDTPYPPDEMGGRNFPFNQDPEFRFGFPDEGFPRRFPNEREPGFFHEPGFGPPGRKQPLLDHGSMDRYGPPPTIPFNTIDYTHRPAAAVLGDDFNMKCGDPYDFFLGSEPPNFRAPAVFDYAHRRDRSPHSRERPPIRERDAERNRDSERQREPLRDRDRERNRERERDKDRERNRDRDRERDSERDRERDRDRKERDRDRNRDRERDRDGHRERGEKRERDWDRDRERTKDRDDTEKDRKNFNWDRSTDEKNYTKDKASESSSYKLNEERNLDNNANTIDAKGSGQLGSQASTFKTDVQSETVVIDDLLCPPGRLTRPKQLVIILRGLPGSGKTYVAKLIKDKETENGGAAPRILSLDDYFMVETEVTDVDPESGKRVKRKEFQFEYESDMEEAYRSSLYKCFKKTIDDRFFPFIIIDAIHDKAKHFEQYWSYAKQRGFQVYIAEMDCKDSVICYKRNIHKRKQEDVAKILSQWEAKPRHFMSVDVRSLVQDGAITEVEMEDSVASEKKDSEEDAKDDEVEEVDAYKHFHVPSRWEQFETTEEKLDQLDGLRTSKKKHSSIQDYLQLPDDYEERECEPGKKRVRWADLEERKEQDRLRAIGFVVGQTDWTKMTDPTHAERALTRTKYI